jgi:hypothetical protein
MARGNTRSKKSTKGHATKRSKIDNVPNVELNGYANHKTWNGIRHVVFSKVFGPMRDVLRVVCKTWRDAVNEMQPRTDEERREDHMPGLWRMVLYCVRGGYPDLLRYVLKCKGKYAYDLCVDLVHSKMITGLAKDGKHKGSQNEYGKWLSGNTKIVEFLTNESNQMERLDIIQVLYEFDLLNLQDTFQFALSDVIWAKDNEQERRRIVKFCLDNRVLWDGKDRICANVLRTAIADGNGDLAKVVEKYTTPHDVYPIGLCESGYIRGGNLSGHVDTLVWFLEKNPTIPLQVLRGYESNCKMNGHGPCAKLVRGYIDNRKEELLTDKDNWNW